jgi:hypothetical protein
VLSPLWVALIAAIGFAGAAVTVGVLMVVAIWWLSGRYFGHSPASMGLLPDGDAMDTAVPARHGNAFDFRPGAALLRSRRFVTLAAATSLGLFAQIGLIAHLFSLFVPALGTQRRGLWPLRLLARSASGVSGLV